MSHEATHVATGATFVSMPTWLLEGFADFVALDGAGVPVDVAAGQILKRIRKDGLPKTLPTTSDLDPTATGLGATYEEAWLACRFLAAEFGTDRLVRFYREVSNGTSAPDAFRSVLGTQPTGVRPAVARGPGRPCRGGTLTAVSSERLASQRLCLWLVAGSGLVLVVLAAWLVPWSWVPGGHLVDVAADQVFSPAQLRRSETYCVDAAPPRLGQPRSLAGGRPGSGAHPARFGARAQDARSLVGACPRHHAPGPGDRRPGHGALRARGPQPRAGVRPDEPVADGMAARPGGLVARELGVLRRARAAGHRDGAALTSTVAAVDRAGGGGADRARVVGLPGAGGAVVQPLHLAAEGRAADPGAGARAQGEGAGLRRARGRRVAAYDDAERLRLRLREHQTGGPLRQPRRRRAAAGGPGRGRPRARPRPQPRRPARHRARGRGGGRGQRPARPRCCRDGGCWSVPGSRIPASRRWWRCCSRSSPWGRCWRARSRTR